MVRSVSVRDAYETNTDFVNRHSVHLRYPNLKDPSNVWTSTAERTELSASSFIGGLVTKSNETERVSIQENAARGANSLTPYKGMCTFENAYAKQANLLSTPGCPKYSERMAMYELL
jgi:hypothetical protein